jgi:hypothetical protein
MFFLKIVSKIEFNLETMVDFEGAVTRQQTDVGTTAK